MKKIKYIIVQAGGRGSRLNHITNNKPKAMVPVNGKPLILRTFDQYPEAELLVIKDYKAEIFTKYLKIFSKSRYKTIQASGQGTCSGIKQSLRLLPDNEPFMVLWCDLYFQKAISLDRLSLTKNNYIGLSRGFACRWSFRNSELVEEKSSSCGIAGVYIFKNKKEIEDIPPSGDFCRYLKEKKVNFNKFFLSKVHELGEIETYNSIVRLFPNTRPFNEITIKNDIIVKQPINQQGNEIAVFEKGWYKWAQKYNWGFIPRVYKYTPLTLQKIEGESLFKYRLTEKTKKDILGQIISNLKVIHDSEKSDKKDHCANDEESILTKTKKRLDIIASLIPHIDEDFININGKKCTNFYKQWHLLEGLCRPFLKRNIYCPIHGDITFSNIILEESTNKVYFIDPRGYYGKIQIMGDQDYEWAKIYYSLVGNYDQFNSKNITLEFKEEKVYFEIASNGWEKLEEAFFDKIKRDPDKIKIYHAIIWLSVTTYAWDNYDSICVAFYNGILLMQNIYEKSVKPKDK